MLDTHQHLIYPDKWPYSWTDDIPALAKRGFRYEDYTKLVERGGCRRYDLHGDFAG